MIMSKHAILSTCNLTVNSLILNKMVTRLLVTLNVERPVALKLSTANIWLHVTVGVQVSVKDLESD